MIKAVLALDLGADHSGQICETEQAALEHLQLYTRHSIQQSLQTNKKSMSIEQELSQHKLKTQELQLELDFQVRENNRIKELLSKLERGAKLTAEQETQCSPFVHLHPAQGTQTDIVTSAKSCQTTLDVESLQSHNESLSNQLAHQTRIIADLHSKLEASGHGLS